MQPIRVLLVEDEFDIQFIVNLILVRSEKFTVTAYDSGLAALDGLSRSADEFDLVIVNFRLPAMNGLQFLQRLRSRPEFSRLPAIIITASPTQANQTTFTTSDVLGVIAKPFDVDTLPGQIVAMFEAAKNR